MLALIILQGTGCTCLSFIDPSILLVNALECPAGKKLIPSTQKKTKQSQDAEKTRKASSFTTFVPTTREGGGFASSPFRLAKLTIAPLQWDINVSRTHLSPHG